MRVQSIYAHAVGDLTLGMHVAVDGSCIWLDVHDGASISDVKISICAEIDPARLSRAVEAFNAVMRDNASKKEAAE